MALENILNNISSNETSVDDAWLTDLSDIDFSKIEGFSTAWSNVSEERRTVLIEKLIKLAKDQFHLNYNYIFEYCLGDVFAIVRTSQSHSNSVRPTQIRPVFRCPSGRRRRTSQVCGPC
jgi:hypothetical protein